MGDCAAVPGVNMIHEILHSSGDEAGGDRHRPVGDSVPSLRAAASVALTDRKEDPRNSSVFAVAMGNDWVATCHDLLESDHHWKAVGLFDLHHRRSLDGRVKISSYALPPDVG